MSVETTPDKTTTSISSSRMDRLCFFDVNRKNTLGQTPLQMTVQNKSLKMLVFLMELRDIQLQNSRGNSMTASMQSDISLKDMRGETMKDVINRYFEKD